MRQVGYVCKVALVIDADDRRFRSGQLPDQLVHDGDLVVTVGVGGVDHMEQKIGVFQLLQRCLEGLHKMMGQLRNKADGI